ncbi:hypothetical protein CQA66_03045 [Helicobacter aurati]|uniref:Uncharacterized protein n=1 Tax=Helicobacter aurati TaxID=137778 RepID=A0A3D8J5W3_9HELI|nr:hypothetical protein [Helicobacter aurati]RDU72879.1 hypothetical protein CQA66_03045 [Helicobacter aurati]
MRYFISLIVCVGLIYASDFEMPVLNQEFIKKGFLQTSRADLGGVLQCENMSGNKVKNLKTFNTIKYNAKAESKALSLIVDSIIQSRIMRIRETEEIPHIKELVTLAKDSTLAKVYLMQLAIADYHSPCYTCLRFIHEQIDFISTFMPEKVNDREVKGFMDFRHSQPSKELLERLVSLDSYALSGEELLCEGLHKQDSVLLVNAYAHFALSGLNTRALNTLMQGALWGNTDAATLILFLLDNGIYLPTNKIAAQMLEIAITNGDYQNALKNNPTITKSLAVVESSALSNIFENIAHWRYVACGFILPATDSRYARLNDEMKKDIALTWFNLISASAIAKQSIYDMGDSVWQQTYGDILDFKKNTAKKY